MKKTKTIISIIVSILVLTIPVFMIWLVTAFIGLKLNYFIGSQTAFLATIGKDLELLPPENHQVVDGMGGLIDKVADYQNHGNAIGYSFRYYVENMEENDNIKILNLNGIVATKENIRSKAYPITDNFYAITVKGKESESVKQFIQWILSNKGQKIVEEVGYVPIGNSKF